MLYILWSIKKNSKIYFKGKLLSKVEINKKDENYTINYLVNALEENKDENLEEVNE